MDGARLGLVRRRVLLSWSSGKDSAWTLWTLRQRPDVEVVGLLTTVDATTGRVSMHSTRLALVEAQARAAGLPLRCLALPWPCSNEVYEREMRRAVEAEAQRGATHIAFGDLALEDLRAYRIRQFEGSELEPLFPLWQEPTQRLARRMIDGGLIAVVTCVDLARLPASLAGRPFDHAFLDALPPAVDPCGENGEFHTCVLGGPMFAGEIRVRLGARSERNGFALVDLIPDLA